MTGDAHPRGSSTRAVAAVATEPVAGLPMTRGPVPAAPYHLGKDEGSESDTYARASHPGWRDLEVALGALEHPGRGVDSADIHVRVFGSGMAAITATLRALLRTGDTVVVPSDGYYQVRVYAHEQLASRGVTVHEIATAALGDEDVVDRALAEAPGRAVVLAETPSNPTLDVVDLPALADRCRAHGALLAVDNTTATPFGQQPLLLGADVVVASGTKSLSGHSDLLMGYSATTDSALAATIERERLHSGSVLGPFETWLAVRSLGTAGLRIQRQNTNALALARLLEAHPAVRGVRYPGLPGDPAHAVATRRMTGFGGLVAFDLPSADAFHRFVDASTLVTSATSFGGIHTTADRRARWGDQVAPGFVRLSCGIEDTIDLVADIEAALDRLA
ncbi:cystathionine gamma-lyase [Rhodococcus sp. HNM0569]|uniref:cystathionine gamma-lyase n=1 Tax=Rhodococcus sp. HNM0569 TaxID=2716340 RepID=UPI00146D237D|nr:cystathionine gamma-lyase [Rhodococcus sp. HNM0569]NLU81568.1 cystathionine gamma-lyase [Rhodococcus sp. HNM0569]